MNVGGRAVDKEPEQVGQNISKSTLIPCPGAGASILQPDSSTRFFNQILQPDSSTRFLWVKFEISMLKRRYHFRGFASDSIPLLLSFSPTRLQPHLHVMGRRRRRNSWNSLRKPYIPDSPRLPRHQGLVFTKRIPRSVHHICMQRRN